MSALWPGADGLAYPLQASIRSWEQRVNINLPMDLLCPFHTEVLLLF